MTLKKFISGLIFLAIMVGIIIYFWEPLVNFKNKIISIGQSKPKESKAPAAFGVGEFIDHFTGSAQVGLLERAKSKVTETELVTIRNALIAFYTDKGKFPENLDELIESGYLSSSEQLLDPWGTKYTSKIANGKFYLISAGKDKIYGTKDDEEIEINLTSP